MVRLHRMPRPRRLGALLLVAASLFLFAACATHTAEDSASTSQAEGEPIKECEAFLTTYARCLRGSGDEAVLSARLEQTRTALAAQARGDDTARANVRRQCADNVAQLNRSCR